MVFVFELLAEKGFRAYYDDDQVDGVYMYVKCYFPITAKCVQPSEKF